MEALLVFAPLVGGALAFLSRPVFGFRHGSLLSVIALCCSAVAAVILANDCLTGTSHTTVLAEWFRSGDLKVAWSIRIDQTAAIMIVVVTVISALVHIYSLDYMHDDSRRDVYFGNISVFTFFMLSLVTADNLLQLYFGWEGVGLSSYLLINHWYNRNSANLAAIKSMIVNREGDYGFCFGIIAVAFVFGSLDFDTIFAGIPAARGVMLDFAGIKIPALTLIGIWMFIGAMAKSAQIGLHIWLPDAMEAPTPVSALIHAATMVTAGVFMLVRLAPLFQAAPLVLDFVTIIGAVTAFVAATTALAQYDIKRIIAYSTMSQLGFMVAACGVLATDAAMFHLITHAFFKALLFLGAGVVIHALSGEQDIRRMGGLARTLPVTVLAMAIGSLALSGIPGFSGFLSKEAILGAIYAASDRPSAAIAFSLLVLTVPLTAFYSWRLMFVVFFGQSGRASHGHDQDHGHSHGTAWLMLATVVLLMGATLISGVAGRLFAPAAELPEMIGFLVIGLAAAGIVAALICYIFVPELPGRIARALPVLYRLFNEKWCFDSVYDRYFVKGAGGMIKELAYSVNGSWIENLIRNQVSVSVWNFARRSVSIQTGFIYHYAAGMITGIAVIILWAYLTQ